MSGRRPQIARRMTHADLSHFADYLDERSRQAAIASTWSNGLRIPVARSYQWVSSDRYCLGVLPIQRLNACVKELTSLYPNNQLISETGNSRSER